MILKIIKEFKIFKFESNFLKSLLKNIVSKLWININHHVDRIDVKVNQTQAKKSQLKELKNKPHKFKSTLS